MNRHFVTAICALAFLLPTGLPVCPASGQRANCPDGVCYPENGWGPSGGVRQVRPVEPSVPRTPGGAAHCRVFVADGSTGSGTLIARNDTTGLVLTCSHLFDGSTANIIVHFPDGSRYGGRLVDRDRANDLAAVLIRRPEFEPIGVDDDQPTGILTACGYGANGQFRRVSGPTSGVVQAVGATDLAVKIVGAVRPGDSGGGVLDRAGRLVGVVWGCRDGETYLTCGRPLRSFLDRVWRGRDRGPRVEPQAPESDAAPQFPGDWTAWRASVDASIAELRAAERESVTRLDATRDSIHARIEERIGSVLPAVVGRAGELEPGPQSGLSYGKLLAGALGVSGPIGLAVILAGGLVGRRITSQGSRVESPGPEQSQRTRTRSIAVDTPPPPQQTVPETHFVPVEMDSFARAHQWACEQVVRKYPGATEVLSTLESLIKQQLAGG